MIDVKIEESYKITEHDVSDLLEKHLWKYIEITSKSYPLYRRTLTKIVQEDAQIIFNEGHDTFLVNAKFVSKIVINNGSIFMYLDKEAI